MQYIKGMQFYQNDKKTAITLGKFDVFTEDMRH